MSSDLSGIQLHYLSSIDDMMELKRWLGERRPVLGVDTETGGFDWWREPLRMVQLGDAMTGWAIPFDDWKGVVKELLPAYDRPIVMHNFKFDTIFLEQNGVLVPRRHLHDSEVLAHLHDASQPKALKAVATRHIDRGFAAGQQKLQEAMATEGWSWRTAPLEYGPYWQYAALDPIMTARVWELFEHHTQLPIYDIEIRSTDVLMRAEVRGIRYDVDYCQRMIPKLRAYAAELRAWAKQHYDVKNLTSDMQVTKVLEDAGWTPVVFTDSGRPSLKKAVAERIHHPITEAMLECKHAEKMAGAYLDNFVEFSHGDRVHAKINPLGTRTGRMSITEPALQTLPRDDVVARDAFIPSAGGKLVVCDYDQIEMRLLAHFSQSQGMQEVFASGRDIFTWMAQQIYQDPSIVKKDERRQTTKTAAYAKGYGAGAEKFAATAGVSDEQGYEFYSAWDRAFPELVALSREVDRVANARKAEEGQAYVVAPSGRRHPLSHHDGTYVLVNYLTQGTAADVLKSKIVEMDAAGLGDYLVLPVHDELDFDVPEPEVAEVCRVIQQVMPELSFTVPITVGIDVVDRWGDKYRKEAS